MARKSHSFRTAAHAAFSDAMHSGTEANPALQALAVCKWMALLRVTLAWHAGDPREYYRRASAWGAYR